MAKDINLLYKITANRGQLYLAKLVNAKKMRMVKGNVFSTEKPGQEQNPAYVGSIGHNSPNSLNFSFMWLLATSVKVLVDADSHASSQLISVEDGGI